MYARLTRLPLKPNSAEPLEQLVHKYAKVIHDLPGHRSSVAYVEDNALVVFTTWDTEQHAQALTQGASEAALRDAAEYVAGPATTEIAATLVHDLRR